MELHRHRSTFVLSSLIIFIFIYFSSIDIISSSFTPGREVSTDIKKRSIGWANPDEMIEDEPDDWVDPFDMLGYDKHKTKNVICNEMEMNTIIKRLGKCEVYMRRFINSFIRSSGLQNYYLQPGSSKQIHFEFIISGSELAILKEFGNSGKGLSDVDAILSNIFIPREGTFFEYQLLNIFNSISFHLSYLTPSYELLIITIVSTIWVTTFYTTYVNRRYRAPIINFLILIFLAGYCVTWIRLYQEAEVERFQAEMMQPNAPPHCRGEELSWYTHLYYQLFTSAEDCSKYYKTKMVHPLAKASPTVVLSETVSQMFLHPATKIAEAYGSFIMGLTNSVNWYLQPIILPFAALVPIIVLFVIMTLCMGYSFRLSPFTGFSILPQLHQQKEYSHIEENKYIESVSDDENLKQKRKKVDSLASSISKAEKPLILLNWSAYKKMNTNEYISEDPNADVKSISNDSMSVRSEDTVKTPKDSEKKTSSPNKSIKNIGGSGDFFEQFDKAALVEKSEFLKNKEHKSNKEKGSNSNQNTSETSGDPKASKETNTSSMSSGDNVQQWLDSNYIL